MGICSKLRLVDDLGISFCCFFGESEAADLETLILDFRDGKNGGRRPRFSFSRLVDPPMARQTQLGVISQPFKDGRRRDGQFHSRFHGDGQRAEDHDDADVRKVAKRLRLGLIPMAIYGEEEQCNNLHVTTGIGDEEPRHSSYFSG